MKSASCFSHTTDRKIYYGHIPGNVSHSSRSAEPSGQRLRSHQASQRAASIPTLTPNNGRPQSVPRSGSRPQRKQRQSMSSLKHAAGYKLLDKLRFCWVIFCNAVKFIVVLMLVLFALLTKIVLIWASWNENCTLASTGSTRSTDYKTLRKFMPIINSY